MRIEVVLRRSDGKAEFMITDAATVEAARLQAIEVIQQFHADTDPDYHEDMSYTMIEYSIERPDGGWDTTNL